MGRPVAFLDDIHCYPNDDHAKLVAGGEPHHGKPGFIVVQACSCSLLCLVVGRARNGPNALFPGRQWLLSGDQVWHMTRI
jgi:hypothetical protein